MLTERSKVLAEPSHPVTRAADHASRPAVCVLDFSLQHVLLMTIACYIIYLLTVALLADYWELTRTFGDNSPYVRIASAIEHWSFADLHVKLFWGLPYTMAAVSSLTRLSNLNALLAISIVASLVAIALVYKLWGGWVTLAFVILSREWLERSLLGGAEPLFLALLLAAFVAARKEKWPMSALLAAFATVVRPMGIFGLMGIGTALLLRRDYRKFAIATAIGLSVGLLYILPLKLYFGDAMANARGYDQADWNSNSPIAFPFTAIVHNALTGGATKLNLLRTGIWILFILLSAAAMVKLGRRLDYSKRFPVEATFWVLYLLFLFTYNSSWARAEFPRFAIPLVPFSAFALEKWVPRSHWLLFAAGIVSAVLSAVETIGFVSVIGILRQAL